VSVHGQLSVPPQPSPWVPQGATLQSSGVHTHVPAPTRSLHVFCPVHGFPQSYVWPQLSVQWPQRDELHGLTGVQQLEFDTHTSPALQPMLSQPLPSVRQRCSVVPLAHCVAPGEQTVQLPAPEQTGVGATHVPPLSNCPVAPHVW